MYVNDLLLVDLVEIPRGSVCISRGVIRAYIVFCKQFFEPRVQELKKNTGKPSYRKPAGTLAKRKKTKRFFPITKCNFKKRCMKNWLILV